MKYIIIDDNKKYAERLLVELKEEGEMISSEGYVLNELVNEINVKAKNEIDTVLLININLKAKNSNRQEQKGIELLIWLRIKDVLNHVVLYSFETLHSLLNRSPKHLISTSQGTTFVQLPYAFKDLQNNLSKKKEDKKKYLADPDNVRETLKPAFSIEKFRHREANWWGVKMLWDINNIVFQESLSYSQKVNDSLLKLNNRIAEYLFSFDDKTFKENLKNYFFQLDKQKHQEIELRIDACRKEIQTKIYLKNTFSGGKYKDENTVKKINEDIDRLNKTVSESIIKIDQIKFSPTKHVQLINDLQNTLKEARPRILCIDDKIDNGWKEAYERLLGININPFLINSDSVVKGIDNIYFSEADGIKKTITSEKPTLILLDLRLFDEEGSSLEIHSLSGYRLLQLIQNDFPHIPILITTASNKFISFEDLIKAGADGFWTKEGVDEQKSPLQSVGNYFRLLELVTKIHSVEYDYLRKLICLKNNIHKGSWFTTHTWINGDSKPCNIESVIHLLQQINVVYKKYLHAFFLGFGTKSDELQEVFFLSGLISKMGIFIELIHGIEGREDFYEIGSAIYEDRCDDVGSKIRRNRNEASHVGSLSIAKDLFFETIDLLVPYLTDGPKYEIVEFTNPILNDCVDKILITNCNGTEYYIKKPPRNSDKEYYQAFLSKLNGESFTGKFTEKRNGILIFNIEHKVIQNLETKGVLEINLAKKGVLIGNIYSIKNNEGIQYFKITNNTSKAIFKEPMNNFALSYNQTIERWQIPNTP